MKNYELLSILSEYPAGAEVVFSSICDETEMTLIDDSDDGVLYDVAKEISEVDYDKEQIIIS